ncbi:NfeD family protein [Sphingomonas sp.]|uniref:NfeD family protein n=1 Tax=Sphingomonas sp. TaxID=28214 RepID=UPI0025D9C775|nr:NfeD family protein [Sphingomonas sp.]
MTGIADHWLWLIAAAVLGIGEIVIPGAFLMWIGIAALITGLATLALPLGVELQLAIFAVMAVVSVYAGRRVLVRNPIVSADPLLNDRGARMIGEIVTAVAPVDPLGGRVKVGDGEWSARGATAAVGERLRVVGIERGVLLVERV